MTLGLTEEGAHSLPNAHRRQAQKRKCEDADESTSDRGLEGRCGEEIQKDLGAEAFPPFSGNLGNTAGFVGGVSSS